MSKHYADRDIRAQGQHYINHVSAMTGEGLHDKGDIAAELAHRDMQIASLQAQRDELDEENRKLRDCLADKVGSETVLKDIAIKNGGMYVQLEGGACGLFAQSFAEQFKAESGINYVEVQLFRGHVSQRKNQLLVPFKS